MHKNSCRNYFTTKARYISDLQRKINEKLQRGSTKNVLVIIKSKQTHMEPKFYILGTRKKLVFNMDLFLPIMYQETGPMFQKLMNEWLINILPEGNSNGN